MAPVTRFAAFKYKAGTTDEQKRKVLDDLIKLYEENAHMVNHGPVGKCICNETACNYSPSFRWQE